MSPRRKPCLRMTWHAAVPTPTPTILGRCAASSAARRRLGRHPRCEREKIVEVPLPDCDVCARVVSCTSLKSCLSHVLAGHRGHQGPAAPRVGRRGLSGHKSMRLLWNALWRVLKDCAATEDGLAGPFFFFFRPRPGPLPKPTCLVFFFPTPLPLHSRGAACYSCCFPGRQGVRSCFPGTLPTTFCCGHPPACLRPRFQGAAWLPE